MKQKHLHIVAAALLLALAVPPTARAYDYDFSATAPSGQTLYYAFISGGVKVMSPDGYGWGDYDKPTGALIIPDSVTYGGSSYPVTRIDNSAFAMCSEITSITIPSTITSVGKWAFDYCSGLTSVTFNADSCTTFETGFYSCPNITTFSIGNTVKILPAGLCANKNGITSITIPNSVTTIGFGAFWGCSGLGSIIIPSSVDSIGNEAFMECTGLTSVTFNAVNCTSSCEEVFLGCENISSFTFGDSVTTIPGHLCEWLPGLSSIVIPRSVSKIGVHAFDACYGLVSVEYNADSCNDAGGFGGQAFASCKNIVSFTFGENVKVIPSYLCAHMTQLTSIIIPDSVTRIDTAAFSDCLGLDSVIMLSATAPTIHSSTFKDALGIIYIPCGSYDSYSNGIGWNSYVDYLQEPDGNFEISAYSEDSDYGIVTSTPVSCHEQTTIFATASYGYHFDHWSNGNIANPDTLTLTSDSVVTAFFVSNKYTVSVTTDDSSLGNVALQGTTEQSATYDYLDTAVLIATPAEHYHFMYWGWDTYCTNNPYHLIVFEDCVLTAHFAIDTHSVTVTSDDISHGTVASSGTEFAYGMLCTVMATASPGYEFSAWSNGETSNPYSFVVQSDVVLTAVFVAEGEAVYTVSVVSDDTTMGTVSGGGQGKSGDEVSIMAISNPGFRFQQWNDGNADSVRIVTITTNVTYTAFFEPVTQGIDEVQTLDAKIYCHDGQVVVEGAEGNAVALYDVSGRLLATQRDEGMPLRFDVPASGAYLVRIGQYAARRVVVIR